MMIFFDTEFTGLHISTTLISIGLAADNGHTFYAELTDFDRSQVDDWIQKHVISNLAMENEDVLKDLPFGKHHQVYIGYSKYDVAERLKRWFESFNEPIKLVSKSMAFDWVLLNELFNLIDESPRNIVGQPLDLSIFFDVFGINHRKELNKRHHNSLHDAIALKHAYKLLKHRMIETPINIDELERRFKTWKMKNS